METLTLRPSEIRYSHDSIGSKFTNGTPLTCVFAHLINGSLEVVNRIPMIEVLNMSDHYWTVSGNRRLFLYRKLEEVGVVETIRVAKSGIDPASKLFKKHFTNDCDGLSIACRQKYLQPSLNEIVSDWQSGQDVVAKWDPLKQVLVEDCQDEDDQNSSGSSDSDETDSDEEEDEEDNIHDHQQDEDSDENEDDYYHHQDSDDDRYYGYQSDSDDDYTNCGNTVQQQTYWNDEDEDNDYSNHDNDDDSRHDYFSSFFGHDDEESHQEDDADCNVM